MVPSVVRRRGRWRGRRRRGGGGGGGLHVCVRGGLQCGAAPRRVRSARAGRHRAPRRRAAGRPRRRLGEARRCGTHHPPTASLLAALRMALIRHFSFQLKKIRALLTANVHQQYPVEFAAHLKDLSIPFLVVIKDLRSQVYIS